MSARADLCGGRSAMIVPTATSGNTAGREISGLRSSGRESRPGESHPEALAELYVSLSTHTAPIMEPRHVPTASEQTTLDNCAKCSRSSVVLAEDVGVTFCISFWPRRPALGLVDA